MRNNTWSLSLPEGFRQENLKLENISKFKLSNTNSFLIYNIIEFFVDTFTAFASRDEIFHKGRDKSELATVYSSYISKLLSGYRGSKNIGALIMEPGKIFYMTLTLQTMKCHLIPLPPPVLLIT